MDKLKSIVKWTMPDGEIIIFFMRIGNGVLSGKGYAMSNGKTYPIPYQKYHNKDGILTIPEEAIKEELALR